MSYTKQTFIDNETVLTAEHLNHIEEGIENCVTMDDIDTLFVSTDPQTLSSDQKARARDNIGAASMDDINAGSGGITEADKQEIVAAVLAALPTWEGGSY